MPHVLRTGTVFARKYRILRHLGTGGFAETYLAEHGLLEGQIVALKMLRPEVLEEPEARARFQQEAGIAMRLRHPNVIPMWEFDVTPEGVAYYTMEASPGDTLKKFIQRERRFDPLRAIRVARQILDALSAAHAVGVVHRDVKPSNVMLEVGPQGEIVRLFDFGVAKVLGGPSFTRTGQIVGTPKYIAPEQAKRRPVDGRCDIYSTGIVLFELLTGRAPFEGPTLSDCLHQHLFEPVPSMASVAPDVEIPEALEGAVRRSLEKDPNARHPTARDFAVELDSVLPLLMAGTSRSTRGHRTNSFLDADSWDSDDTSSTQTEVPVDTATAVRRPSGRYRVRNPFDGQASAMDDGQQSTLQDEDQPPARLQMRYTMGGLERVLHIQVGTSIRLGRQRRPSEGQAWSDVPTFPLRYLPYGDPSMRQATEVSISRIHLDISIDAGVATLTDLSSKGTRIGERRLDRGAATPIDHGDVIVLGPGPLALCVALHRHRATREILALRLTRVNNGDRHAYMLLPGAAPIGSAVGAALQLDARLGVRPLHAIVYPRDPECLMLQPCGDAPMAVAGCPIPQGGAAPFLPGYQATLGGAILALAAYFPDSQAALR